MLKKKLTFFAMGFMIALLMTALECSTRGKVDRNDVVKTDTIWRDRLVKVPQIDTVFINTSPKPKVVIKADPELLEAFKNLETENEKLQAYADAVTKRFYHKTYVSKDSVVTATVSDSVTGTLDFQKLDFTIKPPDVLIKEMTVETTVEKYPDFILSVGGGIRMPLEPTGDYDFEAAVRVMSAKGWNYELGYGITEKNLRFTLTKNLFTKF